MDIAALDNRKQLLIDLRENVLCKIVCETQNCDYHAVYASDVIKRHKFKRLSCIGPKLGLALGFDS